MLAAALLGAGGLLFGLTAVIFVNRLVLHPGVHRTGAPAMWIMISPLAVTSLALQSVAGADQTLGGSWTSAMQEVATFGAAALWGFALWWIAAAAVITRHAGRAALTYTPADWGFVFPSAAMVIATLTLGRRWQSALVERSDSASGCCSRWCGSPWPPGRSSACTEGGSGRPDAAATAGDLRGNGATSAGCASGRSPVPVAGSGI